MGLYKFDLNGIIYEWEGVRMETDLSPHAILLIYITKEEFHSIFGQYISGKSAN